MFKKAILPLVGLMLLQPALAEEEIPGALKASLQQLLGGAVPDKVTPAPLKGLYEVAIGAQVIYMSADGRYLIQGDLVDVRKRENLTENHRRTVRREAVEKLGESSMVVFSPEEDKVRHTVTVFTDIDCGYCRKLHAEMDQIIERGIRVRYLAYPRAGVGSGGYDKLVSVWCADDPLRAMTEAKAGKTLPPGDCANPVSEHYAMGRAVGVSGTPTIILENGDVLPGYLPAQRLLEATEEATGG